VSRARRRLFVIGNFADWKSIDHFGYMADLFERSGRIFDVDMLQDGQGEMALPGP